MDSASNDNGNQGEYEAAKSRLRTGIEISAVSQGRASLPMVVLVGKYYRDIISDSGERIIVHMCRLLSNLRGGEKPNHIPHQRLPRVLYTMADWKYFNSHWRYFLLSFTMRRFPTRPFVCFDDARIEILLGSPDTQQARSPGNSCYIGIPHKLHFAHSNASVRRLLTFLTTFYDGGEQDGRIRGYSPGLFLDICQEALVLGGRRAQLPQCVIIYHGPGGNGKSARFVLRKCVLGEENGGAVVPIVLSAPGEFRRAAKEFTGRHHVTFGDKFGALDT